MMQQVTGQNTGPCFLNMRVHGDGTGVELSLEEPAGLLPISVLFSQ